MATDYTPNYNLDLYASTDKPNLRDQYNAAMGKIDTQMKVNADGITNANANVGTLQAQMGQVQDDVSALESTVETHGTQITDVKKTADDALSLAQTNESDIAGTQSDVTSLTSRVTTVEGTANQNKSDVASLDTRMGVAEGNITQAQTGKAPTNHASSANTYGQGSATNFGHLKVVDSGTAAASTGTAASPKMVHDAINIKPTVLATETVNFTNMTEALSVSVILNAKANLICVSLGEIIVHTSEAIDEVKALSYKLPAQYRPSRKLRTALSVSAAAITVGMNATVSTDGTIEITFGATEAITSGYTVGGNAMFIYGLS